MVPRSDVKEGESPWMIPPDAVRRGSANRTKKGLLEGVEGIRSESQTIFRDNDCVTDFGVVLCCSMIA